ncbi:hypothetical protein [Streptomyces sp. NPDC058434]|uniref:hypothetical protein n=1 Tax=Streptomyces sp. NPDC058434 TaxID=3346498 RepID=UPI0036657D7E
MEERYAGISCAAAAPRRASPILMSVVAAGAAPAFGVRRSAFGVRRSAFGVRRSAFGVRRSAFGVKTRDNRLESLTRPVGYLVARRVEADPLPNPHDWRLLNNG